MWHKLAVVVILLQAGGCASVFEHPAQFGIEGFDEMNMAQSAARDVMPNPVGRCAEFAAIVKERLPGGQIVRVYTQNGEPHDLYCRHRYCADSNSPIPISTDEVLIRYKITLERQSR